MIRKHPPEDRIHSTCKLSYRPKELPSLTGIGEGRIYRLIAERRIRSITLGHRIIVPAEALDEFLRGGGDD